LWFNIAGLTLTLTFSIRDELQIKIQNPSKRLLKPLLGYSLKDSLVFSLSVKNGSTVFASVEVGFNLSLFGPIDLAVTI
jgi:hypothetical protein